MRRHRQRQSPRQPFYFKRSSRNESTFSLVPANTDNLAAGLRSVQRSLPAPQSFGLERRCESQREMRDNSTPQPVGRTNAPALFFLDFGEDATGTGHNC